MESVTSPRESEKRMTYAGPYRLLTLDMDGTALDSSKHVLPSTRAAVHALVALGVPVAFCSGRNTKELAEPHAELPEVQYAIGVNGALVYDYAEGRAIRSTPIATQPLLHAIAAAQAVGSGVHLLTGSDSLATRDVVAHTARYHMGAYHDFYQRSCTPVDDIVAAAREHAGDVLKCNLYHLDVASREVTLARLQGEDLSLVFSEKTSLECTAPGISKARGLADLAAYLGISPSQVVSIGDGPNDKDCLEATGLPIAMGNATPEIKAICRMVVADNDHNGVAEAIRRVFLEA